MSRPNMDLNCNYLLILASLFLCSATALNSDLDSDSSKQRKLFNKLGNNWASSQDETSFDENEGEIDRTGLRFLEEWFKTRQRPLVANTEYDRYPDGVRYETEREIVSSLPNGVQNVYDASAERPTRSKNRHKSTFQSLCPTKRETILLNMDPDYEYRPDYYEEVRCADAVAHSENKIAVCNDAGFSCIQLNGTIFLTRRARGDDCWESETITVAAGCECMWPKHIHGDIVAHH